jgi:cobyrinic acid a,c-diamide synthase
MKSIVIASNSSGGGKTTFTLGLMKAIMNRGFTVQGYKIGPDYIDTAFHTEITNRPSRNLDMHLMGIKGLKASYSRGVGDFGIIEGVMGLYDGKGIDTEFSTAHVARELELPIILILSPSAQVATLCAEINGILSFENANIVGIVLNNISEGYYKLLKATIEKNCKVKVFGYLPSDCRIILGNRHLGLIQSAEIDDLNRKIQICSTLIEEYVDLNLLIECFRETKEYEDDFHLNNEGIRSAVALDKAFSFYYQENIELLKELGEIIYFSPIHDKELPGNIDFLYIGGGYPEVFSKELAENTSMLGSIKNTLEAGLNCYAECGGLMYLASMIGDDEMVGFFDGKVRMTKELHNFGYAEIEVCHKNKKLPIGIKINCHEFHTSFVESNEQKIFKLSKEIYDNSLKEWNCGYVKNNTLAGYPHVHFMGNIEFIKEILKISK